MPGKTEPQTTAGGSDVSGGYGEGVPQRLSWSVAECQGGGGPLSRGKKFQRSHRQTAQSNHAGVQGEPVESGAESISVADVGVSPQSEGKDGLSAEQFQARLNNKNLDR